MKSILRVAAILGVFLVIVAIAAVVYVEWTYGIFRAGRRVSHAELVGETNAVLVVIDPSHTLPYLSAFWPEYDSLPSWAPPLFTPYELAGLLSADHDDQRVEATLAINPQRAGPIILDFANRVAIHQNFGYFEWETAAMAESRPGLLTIRGSLPIPSDVEENAWLLWNQSRTLPSLTIEGGHFVELVLDNRRAGAYAVLASILPYYDVETEELNRDEIVEMVAELKEARFTADFRTSDSLRIDMALEFREENIADYEISFKLLVEVIADAITKALDQRFDTELRGDVKWEENVLVGEFALEGVRPLVRAILGVGTPSAPPQVRSAGE